MKRRASLCAIALTMLSALLLMASPASAQESTTVSAYDQLGADIDSEAEGDRAGSSVAISADGTTAIIGSPFNSEVGTYTGNARIFDWDGTSWTQRGDTISGVTSHWRFGSSVAISADGNTVAIGTTQAARVYDWDGADWTQRGTTMDGATYNFLYSVAISPDGNTVVMGLPNAQQYPDEQYPSFVRILDWDGTNWTQRGTNIYGKILDAESFGDRFGYSVAISADVNTVIIGAPFDDEFGVYTGNAQIFGWDGTDWTQRGTTIEAEYTGDRAGWSVAISADGNTIIVGAPNNNENDRQTGHARIFHWDGTDWTQRGTDLNGKRFNDLFGYSVAISADGNTVIVAASTSDGAGLGYTANIGRVRIFDWDGADWAQRGTDLEGERAFSESGKAIAISADGHTAIIGAPYNGDNGRWAGHARIFRLNEITPPTITVPADITVDAVDASGATVNYTATATDNVDGDIAATCNPAPGSTFAIGDTTVTCTAADATGNTTTDTFIVTVADTAAPTVVVPADMPIDAVDASGATVNYTATATDNVDGDIAATCDPASGSTFAIGDTTVTCTATDTAGNTTTDTFIVSIVDTTAPVLSGVGDFAVAADDVDGAIVSYVVAATDDVDGDVAVTCDPASGSALPVGDTVVTCSATDTAGNTATYVFTVTVDEYEARSIIDAVGTALGEIEGLGGFDQFRVNLAISELGRVDQNGFWADANNLNDSGYGAINGLGNAVSILGAVDDPAAQAQQAELLDLTRELAQNRLDQANAENGSDFWIGLATDQLSRADQLRADGREASAARAYERAWLLASLAS